VHRLPKNSAEHGHHCLLHREMMALTNRAYQMRTNFRMADIHPEPKSPTDLVMVGSSEGGCANEFPSGVHTRPNPGVDAESHLFGVHLLWRPPPLAES
jgi:hypothetical protein